MPRARLSFRPLLCAVTIVLAAGACAERAAEGSAATATPPTPAQVTPAQFASLGWLAGRWRGVEGSAAESAPFYEAYVPRDSVTMGTFAYGDSTFSTAADSGLLQLRGDTLFSGSPSMQWVAVRIDSTGVEFAPWRNASNGFTWTRVDSAHWTATLRFDSAGVAKSRTYDMRAVR